MTTRKIARALTRGGWYAAALFVCVSCTDVPTSTQVRPSLSLSDCEPIEEPDPEHPECPYYGDGEDAPSGTIVDPGQSFNVDPNLSATGYTAWNGDPAQLSLSGAYVCPNNLAFGGPFRYAGKQWYIYGPLVYNGSATPHPSYPNSPHALYISPGRDPVSSDGQWTLDGGVKIACNGQYRNVLGVTVWVGRAIMVGGFGYAVPRSGGSTGSGSTDSEGYAVRDNSTGQTYGGGSMYQFAVDEYVEHGRCTPGYAIVVDGVPVCNG